jgi:hypothetical protein
MNVITHLLITLMREVVPLIVANNHLDFNVNKGEGKKGKTVPMLS